MQLRLPRITLAAFAVIGLAACAGQSTVPSSAPQALAPQAMSPMSPMSMRAVHSDALTANAASPCKVKNFWYFKGTCIAVVMNGSAGKAALKAYKGLGLTLGFSKNDGKKAAIVVGEGTSSSDITGTYQNTKFIDYGTVQCATLKGKAAKCPGKAFLYVLLANASKSTVTFSALPSATITNTGAFPGKSCAAILMGFTSSGIPAGWYLLPGSVKPKGHTVSFPAPSLGSTFPFSSGSFTVLGFTCK
jgi:hypothetical protein